MSVIVTASCCCQSSLECKHIGGGWMSWEQLWIHMTLSCVNQKGGKGRGSAPPSPPRYLWTERFLSQECSLSLFPDGLQHNQWERVLVELPTLRPAPLLSPIRPVKSRVWQRRRGPICCPCYTTLSGWRSWAEMPFTKNSSSKTSTRFP